MVFIMHYIFCEFNNYILNLNISGKLIQLYGFA